ncbi:MAG: hypothetical protein F6K19_10750 [Cyanothece sp. SIO1E1]|nr:hypothetical protein [Cyanothece sp. SIO1E1]
MALEPIYCLETGKGDRIEISQAELSAIWQQVDLELHQSEVYRQVLNNLQGVLDETVEGAQRLVRTVSREAIRLALHHLSKRFTEEQPEPQTEQPVAMMPSQLVISGPSCTLAQAPKPVAKVTTTLSASLPKKLPQNQASAPDQPLAPPKTQSPTKLVLAAQGELMQRQDCLRQIGQELQQARQHKSISLEQIYNRTKVPLHHLKALEEGCLEKLPEDVYIRGFIRRVGDALGLKGSALANKLPEIDPVKAAAPSWRPIQESTAQLRPLHLYLSYAAVMAGAMGGLFWLSQQSSPEGGLDYRSMDLQPFSEAEPVGTHDLQALDSDGSIELEVAPPETFSF